MHRDAFAQIIGQRLVIPFVGKGQDDLGNARAPGSNDFFANTTHRQHLTRERQFPGHGQRPG